MGEIDAFLHALRFMTVLPIRSGETLDADWLTRASKYFPAAGIVVGLAAALVFAIASRYWPGFVPAVLAVATSALLTGALHEDGLADTADGFGGGRSREARLAIMKDSRIGTYGMLALAFSVALRIAAIALMTPSFAWAALIAAPRRCPRRRNMGDDRVALCRRSRCDPHYLLRDGARSFGRDDGIADHAGRAAAGAAQVAVSIVRWPNSRRSGLAHSRRVWRDGWSVATPAMCSARSSRRPKSAFCSALLQAFTDRAERGVRRPR